MVNARQLLAAVLALLVANPVCCCTIGNFIGEFVGNEAPIAAPSCCSKKNAPSGEESPERNPSCPCGQDDSVLVEAKVPQLDGTVPVDFSPELPPSIRITLPSVMWQPRAARNLDLPPPGPSWRLHCCYLL